MREYYVVLLGHLAQAESPTLGDRASRSGEWFSLKREIVQGFVFCLTRRLGEGFGFGRRTILPKREELA